MTTSSSQTISSEEKQSKRSSIGSRPFSAPNPRVKRNTISSSSGSIIGSTENNSSSSSQCNFTVTVRVRPLTAAETLTGSAATVTVVDNGFLVFDPAQARASKYRKGLQDHHKRSKESRYAFDRVFGDNATQRQVFEETTKGLIDGVLDGYNATVFAYGATGAGKTHTMAGTPSDPGIMVLTMCELFDRIEQCKEDKIIDLKLTYLEIYNETIRDLLVDGPSSSALDLREDANQGISISGLSEHVPENVHHVMALLKKGNANRMMSPTQANATSSRSHGVLQIHLEQRDRTGNISSDVRCAKLSLIDLAGSERACVSNNRGDRIREGANINRSLLALGNCINALCASKKPQHIPYRDSKLTRLLKYSLGGNCRTVMIAAVSPFIQHYEDTYNTLVYANRAKNIKTTVERNSVQVNYHIRQYVQIISELRLEIEELKAKLLHQEQGNDDQLSTTPEPADMESTPMGSDETPTLQRLKSQKSLDTVGKEIELLTKESQLYEGSSVDLSGLIMVHEVCLEAIRYLLGASQEVLTPTQIQSYPLLGQLETNLSVLHENVAFLQDELAATYVTVDELRDRMTQYRQTPQNLLSDHVRQLDQLITSSTLKISVAQMERYTKELVRINDIQRQWMTQVCSFSMQVLGEGDNNVRIKYWHQLASSFLESDYLQACQASCKSILQESSSRSTGRWSVSFGSETRIRRAFEDDNPSSSNASASNNASSDSIQPKVGKFDKLLFSGSRFSLAPAVEKHLLAMMSQTSSHGLAASPIGSRSQTPTTNARTDSPTSRKPLTTPGTAIKTTDALETWLDKSRLGMIVSSPSLVKACDSFKSCVEDIKQTDTEECESHLLDLPVNAAASDENVVSGIFSAPTDNHNQDDVSNPKEDSLAEDEEFGDYVSAATATPLKETLVVEDLDEDEQDGMVKNPVKILFKLQKDKRRSFSTSRIPSKFVMQRLEQVHGSGDISRQAITLTEPEDLSRLDSDEDDTDSNILSYHYRPDIIEDQMEKTRTLEAAGRSQSDQNYLTKSQKRKNKRKSMVSRLAGWFSPRRKTSPVAEKPNNVIISEDKKNTSDPVESSRSRRRSMIPTVFNSRKSGSIPAVETGIESRRRRESSLPRLSSSSEGNQNNNLPNNTNLITETKTSRLRRQTISTAARSNTNSNIQITSKTTLPATQLKRKTKKKQSWAAKVIHSFSPFNKKSQDIVIIDGKSDSSSPEKTISPISERTRSKRNLNPKAIGLGQLIISQNP